MLKLNITKYGAHILYFPFQAFIYKCMLQGVFPHSLKKPEIRSVYKKNNYLDKAN